MKPEKILEIITKAADALPEEERNLFALAKMTPYTVTPFYSAGAILGDLANALEREIGTNSAKSAGRLTQRRALERIAKATRKNTARPAMMGTFEQGGARCLCDGYRAIRVTSRAVTMPPNATPDQDEPLDLSRVFKDLESRPAVTLPAPGYLRAQIKIAAAEARAQGVKPSRFGAIAKVQAAQGPVYVNAQYLLDMLESVPDYTTATAGSAYAPLYIAGAEGDAIVLSIRFDAGKNDAARHPVIDCSHAAEERATA